MRKCLDVSQSLHKAVRKNGFRGRLGMIARHNTYIACKASRFYHKRTCLKARQCGRKTKIPSTPICTAPLPTIQPSRHPRLAYPGTSSLSPPYNPFAYGPFDFPATPLVKSISIYLLHTQAPNPFMSRSITLIPAGRLLPLVRTTEVNII